MICINSDTDYRGMAVVQRPLYFAPNNVETQKKIELMYREFTFGKKGNIAFVMLFVAEMKKLQFLGRYLEVPLAAGGFARFTFDEICGKVTLYALWVAVRCC